MRELCTLLMRALSESVGLSGADGLGAMFERPTTLFRIFHYPPHDRHWG